MKKPLIGMLLAFCFTANMSQAATVVVDSLANFNTAIGGGPTETFIFPVDVPNAPSHDFGAFSSTVTSPDASTIHRVAGNRFLFQLDAAGSLVDTRLTVEFDDPVFGLGFDQLGIDFIDISIDNGSTFVDIFNGGGGVSDGFFGIIGDSAFTTIIFEINAPGVGDGGFIDNLVYTTGASPAAVPLPAALPLMGAGFAALGFVGWRRKRNTA